MLNLEQCLSKCLTVQIHRVEDLIKDMVDQALENQKDLSHANMEQIAPHKGAPSYILANKKWVVWEWMSLNNNSKTNQECNNQVV